jgi:hypothetical protein
MDEMRRAQFEVLYESLKGYHVGYLDSAFKIAGFLVLMAGWLLTSRDARHFLATNAGGRRLLVSGLAFGALIYGVLSWRVYALSQQTLRELQKLDFMPAAYYAGHAIDATLLATLILTVTAMMTATAVFVARLADQNGGARNN